MVTDINFRFRHENLQNKLSILLIWSFHAITEHLKSFSANHTETNALNTKPE